MSKLLLDENPLLIMPRLATLIGLNESIVIQQFHYWLKINEKANINFHVGHYWTYNSLNKWSEQFPFWSEKTVQRTIDNLVKGIVPLHWPKDKKVKLLITDNFNRMKIDRTKWYRIDYEALRTLETSPFGQSVQMDRTKCPDGYGQNDLANTRDYTETSTEINNGTYSADKFSSICPIVIDKYRQAYKKYMGKEHPNLSDKQIDNINYYITQIINDDDTILLTDWQKMIDKHFNTNYRRKTDYNANHFFKSGILKNRYFEAVYRKSDVV